MKSGNLNLLKPSGPLQAFNGTALPFFINFGGKTTEKEESFFDLGVDGKVKL
jgi:hypothetical protein